VITPTVIMMLKRVRVKARSVEVMEMNGPVNREVDWGTTTAHVARCATLSPNSSAQRAKRRVICLAVKLVIVPPSIIG